MTLTIPKQTILDYLGASKVGGGNEYKHLELAFKIYDDGSFSDRPTQINVSAHYNQETNFIVSANMAFSSPVFEVTIPIENWDENKTSLIIKFSRAGGTDNNKPFALSKFDLFGAKYFTTIAHSLYSFQNVSTWRALAYEILQKYIDNDFDGFCLDFEGNERNDRQAYTDFAHFLMDSFKAANKLKGSAETRPKLYMAVQQARRF